MTSHGHVEPRVWAVLIPDDATLEHWRRQERRQVESKTLDVLTGARVGWRAIAFARDRTQNVRLCNWECHHYKEYLPTDQRGLLSPKKLKYGHSKGKRFELRQRSAA